MKRLAAAASLLALVAAVVLVVVFAVGDLRRLALLVPAQIVLVLAGWSALVHTGPRRWVFAAIAVVGLVAFVAVLVWAEAIRWLIPVGGLVVLALVLARIALGVREYRQHAEEPVAPPPQRAVLFMNPKSGGGKVGEYDLVARAEALGAEVQLITPGCDLVQMAHDAVASGADLLGAAGGDGTQAIVAQVASENGVEFLCIAAGTRNHFALDLGLDRDDPRPGLDALHDGSIHHIDLARVNGRVFVNNVSLGVYAKVVQEDSYRDAKASTFLAQLPALTGPEAEAFDLHLDGPDGKPIEDILLVLVSNNEYSFAGPGEFGVRESISDGRLGVVTVGIAGAADVGKLVARAQLGRLRDFPGWNQWSVPSLTVSSESGAIEAGVDGEALVLDSPLRFEIQPGALSVRLPRSRPDRGIQARLDPTTLVRLVRLAATGDRAVSG